MIILEYIICGITSGIGETLALHLKKKPPEQPNNLKTDSISPNAYATMLQMLQLSATLTKMEEMITITQEEYLRLGSPGVNTTLRFNISVERTKNE